MLRRLHIENYVLIDSLETSFPEGLIILTGQTGAGKSILLGALSLLLGARSDAALLADPERNCMVEGEFDLPEGDEELRRLLTEWDCDPEGHILTLRRVVAPSGRSRSFLCDCPIALPQLQTLGTHLVDIHSQHQTLQLSDRGFRLRLLDAYAGQTELARQHAAAYAELGRLQGQLDRQRADMQRMRSERAYLEGRYQLLQQADLQEGECEALEQEERLLSHAEEIKLGLCRLEDIFAPAENAGLELLLREAQKQMERTGRFVPAVQALAQRLDSVSLEVADIFAEIRTRNASTEVSEQRLMAVQDRLSLLYDLQKRFDVSSEAELLAQRDALSAQLAGQEQQQWELSTLEKQVSDAADRLSALQDRLHRGREAASRPFAEAVTALLHQLELEQSVFQLRLDPVTPGPSGGDDLLFLFSASAAQPQDISRIASGGELSRIMLSLKAMMSSYMQLPTLIFDEIDSGVSGSVADKMGQLICSMGERMQIFAITHLPQVAAKGRAHYLVSKSLSEDKARTRIERIEGEARIQELARMLSGAAVTPAAIANAKDLLNNNIG